MQSDFTGRPRGVRTAALTIAAIALLAFAAGPMAAQDSTYQAPRTADGKPDLNGIWEAVGAAHWDIEGHAARQGPLYLLGALGAIPAGLGIVEGGEIPYLPEAAKKRDENRADWLARDPAVKCYMPGIPRATYMPFPFQIVQTPEHILIAYEFASASRIIYMNKPDFESPFDTWMGHSRGHWEGETLVVDVTAQVPDTWLDSSGNHHSDKIHVTERYTATSPYHLHYRRIDPNMQLLEFKCVEFAEELLYGHLRKGATRGPAPGVER
jgi:hypothetical protein